MALTQITTDGIKDGTITGTDLTTNVDLVDNQKLRIGTGNDLEIYHNGSHSFISDQGTGRLKLLTSYFNVQNDADDETIIEGISNGAVNLYYNGAKKFETNLNGVKITDANTDVQLQLNSSSGFCGSLYGIDATKIILLTSSNEYAVECIKDGAVNLRYDGSKKIETTSGGVSVTGELDVTGHAGIGSLTVAGVTTSTGGFVGNLTGTATLATDLAINGTNQLLYQASNNDSAILPTGNSGQILQSNGAGSAPQWVTSAPAGAIEGITIREESSVIGSANSISTINFIGESITADAAVAAGIATVTINAISGILVKDGGANVGTGITAFDFAGSLVDVDAVSNTGIATVQIDGLSVKDEGSSVGTAGSITTLNFVGAGIVVDAAANAGVATITSAGGVTNADVVALAIALG